MASSRTVVDDASSLVMREMRGALADASVGSLVTMELHAAEKAAGFDAFGAEHDVGGRADAEAVAGGDVV